MKKMQISAAVLSLLCAAALTACGSDPITADSTAETTAVAETTAETEAETTAAESATTAAATTADAESETTTSAEDETTTTAEETTATEAEQTTAATEASQTEAQATEAPKTETNLFDELKIGSDPAAYLAANTNYSRRESDSCIVNGKDVTYTFADFRLETVIENGAERIRIIDITGSGVAVKDGLKVGSKAADAVQAYGAASDPDCYTYQTADGKLEIFIENDTVTEIVLSPAS